MSIPISVVIGALPPVSGIMGGGPSVGPNLILNGDFADGSAWTLGSGWSISSGSASRVDPGGGSVISQAFVPTAGSSYLVEFDLLALGAAVELYARFIGGADVFGSSKYDTGHYSSTMIAAAGNTSFAIVVPTTGDCEIDNVSVRKIL